MRQFCWLELRSNKTNIESTLQNYKNISDFRVSNANIMSIYKPVTLNNSIVLLAQAYEDIVNLNYS
jgi:hypothetical protein